MKGTSGKSASDRLVGIFSPIEGKSAVNTRSIREHFGEEWGKRPAKMAGGGFSEVPICNIAPHNPVRDNPRRLRTAPPS